MAKQEIEKSESEHENLPAQSSAHNAYEAYGNQATQRNIIGQLLKFIDGEWKAGQNNDVLKAGTQLIACMGTLTIGYQKWANKRPTDSHMGLVADGYQPPLRRDIGDLKEDGGWEVFDGEERDPWQLTNMLVLREPGTAGDEKGLYTFSTSSRGGISAIGMLSKAYGRKIREDDTLLPIVELQADSYQHSERRYGTIDIPVFEIVGWTPDATVEDATNVTIEHEDTGEVTTTKTAPKKAAAASKPASSKKSEPPKKAGKKSTRF